MSKDGCNQWLSMMPGDKITIEMIERPELYSYQIGGRYFNFSEYKPKPPEPFKFGDKVRHKNGQAMGVVICVLEGQTERSTRVSWKMVRQDDPKWYDRDDLVLWEE